MPKGKEENEMGEVEVQTMVEESWEPSEHGFD